MAALDGHCHLRRDELQDLLLALPISDAGGVGLNDEHSDGPVADLQRHADPVDRRCSHQLDLAPLFELRLHLGRDEQRLACPEHVLGESLARLLGREVCVVLVHDIREAQQVVRRIVQGNVEVPRGHQLAHDLMNGGQQFLESRRAHRHLGNAIGGGLQLMGPGLRFAAVLGVERSEHRRAEAMQVVFDDVVSGTHLQILYGRFVTEPPRDDDHRDPGGELLRELQCVARAKTR